jgi:hypothetical protein
VWLLGNLFRTEKRLWRLSGAPWKFFEITTDGMVSSAENYGILRGAILVAAELSDFFPKAFASPITTVALRPDASVPTKPSSNVRTASKSTPQECSTCALPCEFTAIKLNQQS